VASFLSCRVRGPRKGLFRQSLPQSSRGLDFFLFQSAVKAVVRAHAAPVAFIRKPDRAITRGDINLDICGRGVEGLCVKFGAGHLAQQATRAFIGINLYLEFFHAELYPCYLTYN
jgi:hypothetical protein